MHLPSFQRENPVVLVSNLSVTSTRAPFIHAFVKKARKVITERVIVREKVFAPYEVLVTIRGIRSDEDVNGNPGQEYRVMLPCLV